MTARVYPFSRYPSGWFQVAYSDELPPGAVVPLKAFGQELVLFRTEAGQAHVLDAYCPHLGAHLGHGGKVKGEQIECPFHHWRLDGTGRCVAIPHAEKIPPSAAIHAWPLHEINGLILLHHGPDPGWRVPPQEEFQSPDWSPIEKHHWRIRTHVQEISENVADSTHFRYVHDTLTVPETTFEAEGPVFRTLARMKQPTPRGPVDGSIQGQAHGLGYWVIRLGGIADVMFISAQTPIDDESLDLRLSFSYRRGHEGVSRALITNTCRQVDQDVPIWEHKIYRPRPSFAEGDAAVSAIRKWCRQFYAESAPP